MSLQDQFISLHQGVQEHIHSPHQLEVDVDELEVDVDELHQPSQVAAIVWTQVHPEATYHDGHDELQVDSHLLNTGSAILDHWHTHHHIVSVGVCVLGQQTFCEPTGEQDVPYQLQYQGLPTSLQLSLDQIHVLVGLVVLVPLSV